MRSDKLFSILVLAGGALAAQLQACSSSTPDSDAGMNTSKDGGPQDTGVLKDTGGPVDTGVGAEFW